MDAMQSFDHDDFEVLRTAVGILPELAFSALALKIRRQKIEQLPYPLETHQALFELFDGEEMTLGHHRINEQTIQRYVRPELFPIEDDEQFVRAVYLGLGTCNTDANWALQAPPYAEELLAEARAEMATLLEAEGN